MIVAYVIHRLDAEDREDFLIDALKEHLLLIHVCLYVVHLTEVHLLTLSPDSKQHLNVSRFRAEVGFDRSEKVVVIVQLFV